MCQTVPKIKLQMLILCYIQGAVKRKQYMVHEMLNSFFLLEYNCFTVLLISVVQ